MFNKSEILKSLLNEYDVKTTKDVQNMLKDLFSSTIQEMLEAELDEHLVYQGTGMVILSLKLFKLIYIFFEEYTIMFPDSFMMLCYLS